MLNVTLAELDIGEAIVSKVGGGVEEQRPIPIEPGPLDPWAAIARRVPMCYQ